METEGGVIDPLCQYLFDRQRYGDLYRLSKTNHCYQSKCQPYLDQLIVQFKKQNPDQLLEKSCYQHDNRFI